MKVPASTSTACLQQRQTCSNGSSATPPGLLSPMMPGLFREEPESMHSLNRSRLLHALPQLWQRAYAGSLGV